MEGLYTWLGMFAPPQLPPAILEKLSAEVMRVMRQPEVAKRALKDGYEIVASTPARFTSDIQAEVTISSRIIREKGIKAE